MPISPRSPEISPRSLAIAPRSPEIAPRSLEISPRSLEISPRSLEDHPGQKTTSNFTISQISQFTFGDPERAVAPALIHSPGASAPSPPGRGTSNY